MLNNAKPTEKDWILAQDIQVLKAQREAQSIIRFKVFVRTQAH